MLSMQKLKRLAKHAYRLYQVEFTPTILNANSVMSRSYNHTLIAQGPCTLQANAQLLKSTIGLLNSAPDEDLSYYMYCDYIDDLPAFESLRMRVGETFFPVLKKPVDAGGQQGLHYFQLADSDLYNRKINFSFGKDSNLKIYPTVSMFVPISEIDNKHSGLAIQSLEIQTDDIVIRLAPPSFSLIIMQPPVGSFAQVDGRTLKILKHNPIMPNGLHTMIARFTS